MEKIVGVEGERIGVVIGEVEVEVKMQNAYVLEELESGEEVGMHNVIHLKSYKREY